MKRAAKNIMPTRFSALPKSYAGLCAILMPRTIHDQFELENVTAIIDLLAGHALTRDQADYLDTLATLVADFEDQRVAALPTLAPHEFLAAHLKNIGMSVSAWGKLIGIDRSTASRLVRGERKLNTTHIRHTAEALALPRKLLI